MVALVKKDICTNNGVDGFPLDKDYEDSPRVTAEVYYLYSSGKYLDALKEQSKVLRRRRGHCSSWMADNDLGAVLWIAEDGKINLRVSELYADRPLNMNSTWRLVDKVIEAIKNLE